MQTISPSVKSLRVNGPFEANLFDLTVAGEMSFLLRLEAYLSLTKCHNVLKTTRCHHQDVAGHFDTYSSC